MRRATTVLLLVAALAVAGRATAQTAQSDQSQPATQTQATPASDAASTRDTRPAFTTFSGDTGLWFVPTADLLPNGKVSVSAYRAGFNFQQGYSNVAHFAGTFGVGIKDRAELFGSFASSAG